MAFKDFPKQEQGIQLLQRSLERGRLAHAYLFSGHQLEELEAIARTLAKTLNCLHPTRKGGVAIDCCDHCLACQKIEHSNHADVHWVRPESKTRIIKVEQVRGLIQEMNLKPSEAEYKVAVIVAADRLKTEAANAFLKTLEEPPPKSILILLTTEPQRLLETILSRCLRLNFGGDGPRQLDAAQMEWLKTFSEMAAAEQKSLLGRYRLMDVLLRKLNELKNGIEEALTARSPIQQYKDAEQNLVEKWENELSAAVEAEYRRQRADLLGVLHWWLRDVWLRTLGTGVRSQEPGARGQMPGATGSRAEEGQTGKTEPAGQLLSFPDMGGTEQVAQRISAKDAMENLAILNSFSAGWAPMFRKPSPWRSACSSCACEPMRSSPKTASLPDKGLLPRLFAGLFGVFFGLTLLKFGNPPIFERFVVPPTNGWEFVFNNPWPIGWAYGLLGLVAVAGLFVARRNSSSRGWLLALPLAWLVWQCLAASHTLSAELTRATLMHFAACVVCFYLGFFSLSRAQCLTPFWLGLLGGFLLVLAVGWEQHFGGLDDTRRYFFAYVYSQLKEVQPEYLKKISSQRIFSTLFYANTLAGALLLLLPPLLAFIGQMRKRFTLGARAFIAGTITVAALGCLYWSGSKGGWLLMLALGLLALLRLSFARRLKVALVAVVLLAGLTGFFWKYSGFFHKGATSVVARFDYWQAAVRISAAKPVWGTGPGTFAIPYQKIKRPESEMARLTHNDYLEQASDSGVPAFALYTTFILAGLILSFRKLSPQSGLQKTTPGSPSRKSPPTRMSQGLWDGRLLAGTDWQAFALWLGVLGWAVQSLFEFGLYIPALAWPAFAFLGWLLARNPAEAPNPAPATQTAKRASPAPSH